MPVDTVDGSNENAVQDKISRFIHNDKWQELLFLKLLNNNYVCVYVILLISVSIGSKVLSLSSLFQRVPGLNSCMLYASR